MPDSATPPNRVKKRTHMKVANRLAIIRDLLGKINGPVSAREIAHLAGWAVNERTVLTILGIFKGNPKIFRFVERRGKDKAFMYELIGQPGEAASPVTPPPPPAPTDPVVPPPVRIAPSSADSALAEIKTIVDAAYESSDLNLSRAIMIIGEIRQIVSKEH